MLFQQYRLIFGVLIAAACFCLAASPASADTESIEKHLGKLLDAPADGVAISVIQTKNNAYRTQIDTGLLLNAIKLKPNGAIIPKQTTFYAKTDSSSGWSFSADQAFSASWHEKIDAHDLISALNAKHGVVSGRFQYDGPCNLRIAGYQASIEKLGDGYSDTRKWAYWAFETTDTPERNGLSSNKVSVQSQNYKQVTESAEKGRTAYFIRDVTLEALLNGVNFAPIKTMLSFGDRLEMHNSEEAAAYPDYAVLGATNFDMVISAKGLVTRTITPTSQSSFAASSISGGLVGHDPSEKAKYDFWLTMSGMNLGLSGPHDAWTALAPTELSGRGEVTGLESRLIFLALQPASRLGLNNQLAYLKYDYFPDRMLNFGNVFIRVKGADYAATVKASFKVNLDHPDQSDGEVTFQSTDIDRLIARYRQPASQSQTAAQMQFLLYFLKGAGRRESNGALSWSIVSKAGKSTINGVSFNLPKIPPLQLK